MNISTDYVVQGLSRAEIRSFACSVRDLLGVTSPRLDIVRLLDIVLFKIDKGFSLEICDRGEMEDNHGLTIPSQKIIKIRDDVYARAEQGVPRDRFTLAHELGHYILHSDEGFARRIADSSTPAFRKSEWQANAFAGELLVDSRHVRPNMSVEEIAELFGVSFTVAEIQHSECAKLGDLRVKQA